VEQHSFIVKENITKVIVKNKLYSALGDVFSTYTIIMNNIYLFKDAEVFNEEEKQMQFDEFLLDARHSKQQII